MHEVWRDLGLRKIRVEQLYIRCQELDIIWERVVHGKYGMSDLLPALKES